MATALNAVLGGIDCAIKIVSRKNQILSTLQAGRSQHLGAAKGKPGIGTGGVAVQGVKIGNLGESSGRKGRRDPNRCE